MDVNIKLSLTYRNCSPPIREDQWSGESFGLITSSSTSITC